MFLEEVKTLVSVSAIREFTVPVVKAGEKKEMAI
jgi:hypothetical protein